MLPVQLSLGTKVGYTCGAVRMPIQPLSESFQSFFGKLNPSDSKVKVAAAEHAEITRLITDANGSAAQLSPHCFLQGSYRQQTAIHDINDVDLVVLCRLWYPGSPNPAPGTTWSRDRIFDAIASALKRNQSYANKIEYGPNSTCIKVNGAIKVEVLPAVYPAGNSDPDKEPFKLFRPEHGRWEDGYARYHQQWLTWKNSAEKTAGNFIPAIKVFKHIRTRYALPAVSFHIECFLFRRADELFLGSPADYLAKLFSHIANWTADAWYNVEMRTPCNERNVFTNEEWTYQSWQAFHELIRQLSAVATAATVTTDRNEAIRLWQVVLGDDFFPRS